MSYSSAGTIRHDLNQVDFGTLGTYTADSIQAPSGENITKGYIVEIGIRSITETFVGTTTDGIVQVGTAADPDAYCQLEIAAGTAATDSFNTRNDTDAIIEPDVLISDLINNQLEVTFVAATGGTPAGIATPYVDIYWF